MFRYQIGNKIYVQKPLVLGQIRQLLAILKDIKIQPSDSGKFLLGIGDQVPEFLAIVLTEEGKSLKGKNLKELATEIEFEIDSGEAIKVIEDFFECNPTSLFLERIGNLGKIISGKIGTGSKSLSSSFHEEISPGEMTSSGDTLPPNVSPSPDIL